MKLRVVDSQKLCEDLITFVVDLRWSSPGVPKTILYVDAERPYDDLLPLTDQCRSAIYFF